MLVPPQGHHGTPNASLKSVALVILAFAGSAFALVFLGAMVFAGFGAAFSGAVSAAIAVSLLFIVGYAVIVAVSWIARRMN